MKTIKTISNIFALILTLSLFVACDNKKNNGQAINATAGFQYINGTNTCISRANNQQVDVSYCQTYGVNQANNGYSYVNGVCMSTYNNMQVDQSYCLNNYNGGYGTQMQCNGNYWVWSGFSWSQVSCFGTSCSGQTVYPSGASSQAQAIRCL